MSQRKTKQNGTNGPSVGADSVLDSGKIAALQQYRDTEGHFSLVRCAQPPFSSRSVHGTYCGISCRNFRLADLVTIMNGVCGSFSVFMSAKYLLTSDEDYLWSALIFPMAGCMFDFMDGKIARWRKESSMLGQELDSLADLVRAVMSAAHFINISSYFANRYRLESPLHSSHLSWAYGHTWTRLSSQDSSAAALPGSRGLMQPSPSYQKMQAGKQNTLKACPSLPH